MSPSESENPTELELEILKVLWKKSPLPVRDVRAGLEADAGRTLAHTTVITMLNIMHRKGAQDIKRAKIFNKLTREIAVAAKSGLPDPAANPRLRAAIQAARVQNMPRDRIERAIKSGSPGGDDFRINKHLMHSLITRWPSPTSMISLLLRKLQGSSTRSSTRSSIDRFTKPDRGAPARRLNQILKRSRPLGTGNGR